MIGPDSDKKFTQVTKKIAKTMASMVNAKDNSPEMMSVFIGLGIALGACFEVATGIPADRVPPQKVLKWALDLPLDSGEKRVTLN